MTWNGDFSTGDTSQWPSRAYLNDAIVVVPADQAPPGCPAGEVAHIRVDGGRTVGGWGTRAEVIRNPDPDYGNDGQRDRVVWHTHWPSPIFDDTGAQTGGLPVDDLIFTDFHSKNISPHAGGGVNVNMRIQDGVVELVLMGGRFEGPIPKGTPLHVFAPWAQAAWGIVAPAPWGGLYAVEYRQVFPLGLVEHDRYTEWLLAVDWSSTAGHVGLWRDGEQAVYTDAPTLFSTAGVVRPTAFHQGLYVPGNEAAIGEAFLVGARFL